MPTTVEFEGSLKTELSLDISTRLELGQTLLSGVQAIDIGLVVLGVVKSHDLLGDRRLERLWSQPLPCFVGEILVGRCSYLLTS